MIVTVGIPCYSDVDGEVLEDYMRFMYYLGRRMPQHDFFLAVKRKTEQFRARNAIVTAALQVGSDYVLMIDDDHIIDWETSSDPNPRYGFLQEFIDYLEEEESRGIIGALYYHRGGDCRPVLMKEHQGGYLWMLDHEIGAGIQEVDVTGGGCFLIKASVFDKVPDPWFEPEYSQGTDVQICSKAKAFGFSVWCDTGTQIGHVLRARRVITPHNRHQIAAECAVVSTGSTEGINQEWAEKTALQLYRMDAEQYLGIRLDEMEPLWYEYEEERERDWTGEDLEKFYGSRGKSQLARQVMFHHLPHMVEQMALVHSMINTSEERYGLDFGCGSAPVGFELAMRGHRMDFVDIDGAGAYEFTKWRANKNGMKERCGFKLAGPYDYILLLDIIEHLKDWKGVLGDLVERLKPNQAIITNYFHNRDFNNIEHISMDHSAVQKHLVDLGVYPVNQMVWVKTDMGEGEDGKDDRK